MLISAWTSSATQSIALRSRSPCEVDRPAKSFATVEEPINELIVTVSVLDCALTIFNDPTSPLGWKLLKFERRSSHLFNFRTTCQQRRIEHSRGSPVSRVDVHFTGDASALIEDVSVGR